MQHAPIHPRPTARDLLTQIITAYEELSGRGSLCDAPTDLLNALDAGDDAARELMEWLDSDPSDPVPALAVERAMQGPIYRAVRDAQSSSISRAL